MSFSQQSTAWQLGLLHAHVTLCAHVDVHPCFQLRTFILDKTSEQRSPCPAGLVQPLGHAAHLRAVALHLPHYRPGPSTLPLSATPQTYSRSPHLTGLPSRQWLRGQGSALPHTAAHAEASLTAPLLNGKLTRSHCGQGESLRDRHRRSCQLRWTPHQARRAG